MSVDATTAAWLRATHSTALAKNLIVSALWGDAARDTEIVSPFADFSDAQAEAVRQLEFLSYPIEALKVMVEGLRADLIGQRIDLSANRGDLAGARCLVIGVAEQSDTDMTILTVLRRLT